MIVKTVFLIIIEDRLEVFCFVFFVLFRVLDLRSNEGIPHPIRFSLVHRSEGRLGTYNWYQSVSTSDFDCLVQDF